MRVKGTVIPVILCAAMLVASCDFMRKVAGRPTTEDLQAMAAAKEQEEARAARALQERQQREKELQCQADSLFAVQTLEGIMMNRLSDLFDMNVRITTELPAKYSVVLGAFSDASNADNLISRLKAAGYEASPMRYRSGKTAVLACSTDSFVELGKSFASLQKDNYCPKDVWVIVKE